jgi:hypothetical protein
VHWIQLPQYLIHSQYFANKVTSGYIKGREFCDQVKLFRLVPT